MLSNNPKAHKCTKCKTNYYFQSENQNCFKSLEGYYLDEVTPYVQNARGLKLIQLI